MIRRNQGGKAALYILYLIIGCIIGAVIGGQTIRMLYSRGVAAPEKQAANQQTAGSSATPVPPDNDALFSRRNAIVRATEQVSSCVVGVVVTQMQVVRNPYYFGDFFDLFFEPNLIARPVESMGSGIIISADGLILTNFHVVDGAQKLFVDLPAGKEVEGTIIGMDPATDLALIRIAGDGHPVAKLGNSDSLLIGEWSIAIGNPFGFLINDAHPSVTVGVISAINRNFAPSEGTVYQNMIQTDAAINPGNSGGPLVNAAGEVIGINTFIFTSNKSSKGSIGIGFAIPINRAKRVVRELVAYGKRRPIWTGIFGSNLDRSVAMALGYDRTWGVVITDLAKNSPGDVAGLAAGDIIVRMDNTRIYSMADFEGLWADCYVGDVVEVHYVRKGKELRTSMLLKAMPVR